LHERSQSGRGGWGFEGEEAVEGLGESVFGGGAVAGQGVEAGDVGCDRAGGKCRGVEAIDLAGFPDCQGHRADTGFFGGGCGVVLGAEGLEDCVEFKGRGGEAGTETVFASVAAGRNFAAGGSRGRCCGGRWRGWRRSGRRWPWASRGFRDGLRCGLFAGGLKTL
jgi:hypothetical protein